MTCHGRCKGPYRVHTVTKRIGKLKLAGSCAGKNRHHDPFLHIQIIADQLHLQTGADGIR